ncbi:MAG TPA: ketoacyl-ACP synthase III [Bacteroidales bacterium]|nr:ketoacyl-ACP synthase III [Bacteroidales bacterium]
MIPVRIKATGIYAPGKPIDNNELKMLAGIDFDSEKTEQKIGIFKRHIAHLRGIDETTADFATKAAQNAIAEAGINPEEIGLIIVATDTPEFISPATSIVVQGRIQGKECWSTTFDINASCASFTIAYDTAVKILSNSPHLKYVLVIGVYNMPAFVRPNDAFGYSIFADGAGAFLIERAPTPESGYIAGLHLADGTQWDFIGIYAGGSRNPITHEILDAHEFGLQNLKPLPGERNVKLWPIVANKLLADNNLTANQVDHFIFTQINKSVILKVMDELKQPITKTTFVMDRYGYTGSACVPMAFHHAITEDRVKRGDRVVFIASGAGLAVGSNLFTY